MDTICILYVPAKGETMLAAVDNRLETWQALVGGYIETDRIVPGVVAIVNENGIALNLPLNRNIKNRVYFGDVVFAGYDPGAEDFRSLTPADCSRLVNAGHFDEIEATPVSLHWAVSPLNEDGGRK